MKTFEVPASPAQRRLWLIDQMSPRQCAYNVPWVIDVEGPMDANALRAALAAAVDRHEALRTVFRESAGDPVQVVFERMDLTCETVDVSGEEAAERVKALACTCFDLAAGPLLRAELLRLGAEKHLLVLVFHHIIVDGWSFQIFFQQLLDDYADRPVAPPIQYADFALRQAERAGATASEEYWRDELAGAEFLVDLPSDRRRHEEPSLQGGQVEFSLPAADAVRAFARERGVTPFAVLLAGFGAALAKLTNRSDLLIGVPVSGRTQPQTEQMLGLFMNTLPLRLRIHPDTTFDGLVASVRETVVRGLAHQDVPFERIAELCRAPRGLGWSPLVQVMFQWEELPGAVESGGLRWQPELRENGGSKLDLTVAVADRDGEMSGRLVYAADLFDEATVRRFLDCWLTLLSAALQHPQARLLTHPLTQAHELSLVTGDWAIGPALPPGDATAIAMLAPKWTTDGPARIAGTLRRLGVGPESRVGLCLPRDQQMIAALLGVWWAGAAYVPLDPAYPQARLEAMVADSGLDVVLGVGDFAGATVVSLDQAITGDPVPRSEVPPEAAAYTIFTSGSTGRPKGVTITQGNVAALLQAFAHLLPIGPDDHLVAVTTIAFDISVLELLLPLVCGAKVTVADAATAADAMALHRLLRDTGATALQATPATWRALAMSGPLPAQVRLRLCGGEVLPPDLADVLQGDGVQLWNVYGPTETTVWSAAGLVTAGQAVHIGPPIPGTRMYVLDSCLHPVPPGVVGQIYLGGAGVGRGYHGRPGLTAQRFLPDPFSDSAVVEGEPAGGRLYATGDLARWLPDGRWEFLGRDDHQVKIRGQRIEIGEIEVALRDCPGVTDAAAAVTTGDDPRLVAYVVGEPADLRERLAQRLPDYMIPAAFVTLNALPRTPNGKLDRKSLPAPQWGAVARSRDAATPLEQQLALMWRDLLGLAELPGADDNFFALGGHSLTATKLLARVRSEVGVAVPLGSFFRKPMIAHLALAVEAERDGGRVVAPIRPQQIHELDDDALDALLQELMR